MLLLLHENICAMTSEKYILDKYSVHTAKTQLASLVGSKMVILSLLLIQEGQLSVSVKRMCTNTG